MNFGFTLARASLAMLGAGVLSAAAFAAPAAGATTAGTCASSGKCYLVTVSPVSVPAGDSASFEFTVTNEATTQKLGSIQITAPPGYVVTGASGPATGTTSDTSSSALFLYLGLGPGQSATLTVDATAPCGGGTSQWGTEAKQSNQFNGSGNDFQLDPASDLSAMVSGTCSLSFTPTGEPSDTAVGAVITNAVGSTGGPVQVEVLDGSGSLLTNSDAPVTLAIGANSPPGSLSGTTTADASGGVATFSNVSISQAGLGYSLVASSPGTNSAISAYFSIDTAIQPCPATSACSASSSAKTTSGTVTTTSASSDEFLGIGLGGVSYSCPTYTTSSDPLSFDVLSQSGVAQASAQFSVQLEISKSTVQASGHPGASTWQICYASTQQFTAVAGTSGTTVIGGVTYDTGLLPDCTSSQGAPCVQARNKDNAGDVIVTFLAAGDPVGRA